MDQGLLVLSVTYSSTSHVYIEFHMENRLEALSIWNTHLFLDHPCSKLNVGRVKHLPRSAFSLVVPSVLTRTVSIFRAVVSLQLG